MRFYLTRVASLTAVAVALTACADAPVTAPAAPPTPRLNAGPPNGFATVRVKLTAPSASQAKAPIVNNLADAVARVADGGTILVDAGTWEAGDIIIDKSLTVEPANAGERPVIVNSGYVAFSVTGGDLVTFRGLAFEVGANYSAIYARGAYGKLVVDGTDFTLTTGTTGILAGSSTAANAKVTVTNSTFSGGAIGVFFAGAHAETRNNTFDNHSFSGIQYQSASSGIIEGNSSTRCGRVGCIRVHSPSGVVIAGNTVHNEHPRTVQTGILAFAGGTVTIQDNVVLGAGGVGRDVAHHPFSRGILVSGSPTAPMEATVLRNRVSGAYEGIILATIHRGQVEENRVDLCGAWSCIAIFGGQSDGAIVQVRRNTLRSSLARRTFFAVQSTWASNSGVLSITDNDIAATAAPANVNDPATYGLDIAFQNGVWYPGGQEGIPLGTAVEFSRNRISNTAVGVRAFHGGVIEGRDNVFTRIFGEVFGAHDRGVNRLQFNDVNGYHRALAISGSSVGGAAHNGTLEVRCNYWGGSAPVNTAPAPEESYSPYATAPIAGTGATSCSGGL